jgi:hypothetical protein
VVEVKKDQFPQIKHIQTLLFKETASWEVKDVEIESLVKRIKS